ncbi:MAG: hypothetical protein ABWY11_24130 [Umezawaea sp.]
MIEHDVDETDSLVEPMADLIREIGVLTTRWRGDGGQPVVSLTGSVGASPALATVVDGLRAPRSRQVPHARVDASGTDDLRALLSRAAEELVTGPFGRGHLLRFRRFWFLDWLMRQPALVGTDRERRAELVRLVRRASGPRSDLPRVGASVLTGWSGLVLLVVSTVVPAIAFRVLVSGRVPGPGRVFRWLMRQRYASRQSSDFWAFALRLTDGASGHRDLDQVRRLLVHAFLQDLRDQYRRVPWRIRPWRRTAYPVLLVDNVRGDGPGGDLLRLVAVVRKHSDTADPLLIVTAEDGTCPVGTPPCDVVPLTMADDALRRWRELPRGERGSGRFLVRISASSGLERFPALIPEIEPRRPPWFAHRAALVLIPLLPALAGSAWLVHGLRSDCAPVHFGGRVEVSIENGQCVGYSDDAGQFFGSDDGLRRIQERIFEQNREAKAIAEGNVGRPQVTVVYLGTLTKPGINPDEETFAAEREELEGIAVAQHQAKQDAVVDPNAPVLRVVIANAGLEMRSAEEVARSLTSLQQDDPTVVGIVGLVESRMWTRDALKSLRRTGLPVIAPTLSADGIGSVSTQYLQIAPPNVDQAEMVRRYTVEELKKESLVNYYSFGAGGTEADETDLYVNTLRQDLKAAFPGGNYQEHYWNSQSLGEVCPEDGSFDGVVFFGGRYSDFGGFAKQLAADCGGRMPVVIGDDSVNRYMANASLRKLAPENLRLAYVSKGSLAFCDRLASTSDPVRQIFRTAVRDVLGKCDAEGKLPVGERVGLAYDGVQLLLLGVRDKARQRLNEGVDQAWDPGLVVPGQLHPAILGVAGSAYQGVTGVITFDGDGVVKGKPLSLLCATDIKKAFQSEGDVPKEIYRIGAADSAPPPTAAKCE